MSQLDTYHEEESQDAGSEMTSRTPAPIEAANNKDAEPSLEDFGPAPDGGLQAWLVAAGASATFFAALGYSNTFGVFQEYYITHQLSHKSATDIAWIGSVSTFLQFAGGAIGGPLFDRYGAWVIRPPAILYIVAIMMVSLCHEYWQFMLAQGVFIGLVQGLLQFPCMAAVSQYFHKNRGAALGATIAGSSIGGVVLPIALSKMLNSSTLGFGWSVRIIGFIMAPMLLFACVTVRARLPPRKTAFFLQAPLKNPRYLLLTLAFGLTLCGMFAALFFYPTYAVSRGMDATLASYMLAIINAASIFGRVVPGILSDKIGRINTFAFGGVASGITILCMSLPKSTAAIIVYAVFIGFSTGTIISGGAAAISATCPDPRNMGTYIGMAMTMVSVAVFLGPPVDGALVSNYSTFLQMTIYSGVMCMAGGLIAVAAKMLGPEGLLSII